MVSLTKAKTSRFYLVLSSLLIISGLALVITADYSTKLDVRLSENPTSNSDNIDVDTTVEVLNESELIYPWSAGGPEYISKNSQFYEFCKQSKCWGFDASIIEITNNGEAYDLSSTLTQHPKLEFSSDHQNFNLNYSDSNVYLCSDEFCWVVGDGVNNIQPTNQFQNISGVSSATFGEIKAIEL